MTYDRFKEIDDDNALPVLVTDGSGNTVDSDHPLDINVANPLAGERNVDSETNSYLAVRTVTNCSIISKTTAVTIGAGAANDTHLFSVFIHTALTGTLAITGFSDSDGAAQTFTVPAGYVGVIDFKGAINSGGALTMTASNAADDNKIAVFWRAA